MIPDLSNYFSNSPIESPYKSKEELTKALQQKYGNSSSSLVIGTTPEAFAALVDKTGKFQKTLKLSADERAAIEQFAPKSSAPASLSRINYNGTVTPTIFSELPIVPLNTGLVVAPYQEPVTLQIKPLTEPVKVASPRTAMPNPLAEEPAREEARLVDGGDGVAAGGGEWTITGALSSLYARMPAMTSRNVGIAAAAGIIGAGAYFWYKGLPNNPMPAISSYLKNLASVLEKKKPPTLPVTATSATPIPEATASRKTAIAQVVSTLKTIWDACESKSSEYSTIIEVTKYLTAVAFSAKIGNASLNKLPKARSMASYLAIGISLASPALVTEVLSRGLPFGFDWINQNESLLPRERMGFKAALLLAGVAGFLPALRRISNQITWPSVQAMRQGVNQTLARAAAPITAKLQAIWAQAREIHNGPGFIDLYCQFFEQTLGNEEWRRETENWLIATNDWILDQAPNLVCNVLNKSLDTMIAAPRVGVNTAKSIAAKSRNAMLDFGHLYDRNYAVQDGIAYLSLLLLRQTLHWTQHYRPQERIHALRGAALALTLIACTPTFRRMHSERIEGFRQLSARIRERNQRDRTVVTTTATATTTTLAPTSTANTTIATTSTPSTTITSGSTTSPIVVTNTATTTTHTPAPTSTANTTTAFSDEVVNISTANPDRVFSRDSRGYPIRITLDENLPLFQFFTASQRQTQRSASPLLNRRPSSNLPISEPSSSSQAAHPASSIPTASSSGTRATTGTATTSTEASTSSRPHIRTSTDPSLVASGANLSTTRNSLMTSPHPSTTQTTTTSTTSTQATTSSGLAASTQPARRVSRPASQTTASTITPASASGTTTTPTDMTARIAEVAAHQVMVESSIRNRTSTSPAALASTSRATPSATPAPRQSFIAASGPELQRLWNNETPISPRLQGQPATERRGIWQGSSFLH